MNLFTYSLHGYLFYTLNYEKIDLKKKLFHLKNSSELQISEIFLRFEIKLFYKNLHILFIISPITKSDKTFFYQSSRKIVTIPEVAKFVTLELNRLN